MACPPSFPSIPSAYISIYNISLRGLLLGREIKNADAQEIIYALRERSYKDQINKAHSFASELLLTLLIGEYHLLERLG